MQVAELPPQKWRKEAPGKTAGLKQVDRDKGRRGSLAGARTHQLDTFGCCSPRIAAFPLDILCTMAITTRSTGISSEGHCPRQPVFKVQTPFCESYKQKGGASPKPASLTRARSSRNCVDSIHHPGRSHLFRCEEARLQQQ